MRFIQRQLRRPSGLIGGLLPSLWNRWNRELHKVAFQALDIQSDDRVLEIGFGGGSLLKRILPMVQNGYVAGVDHSLAVCQYCHKRLRKAVHSRKMGLAQSSAENLPFGPECFSKVFSVNSVFFWPEIPQAFQEIARILKPGGRHILIFTDPESLKDRPVLKDALTPIASSEVRDRLSESGFQVIRQSEHGDGHRWFHLVAAQKMNSNLLKEIEDA